MILILSRHDDPHVRYVLPRLEARGARVFWFDPRDFPRRAQISLELAGSGFFKKQLRMDGRTIDLDEITAVWLRRPGRVEAAPEVVDPGLRKWVRHSARDALAGAFELLDCRWLPAKPDVCQAAANKVLQLAIAGSVGFCLPKTCITNDPEALLGFYAAREDRIVSKPARSELPYRNGEPAPIYTQVVQRRQLLNAGNLRHAPMIFQAYVPKRCELRATVVGEQVFTAAIDSQANRMTKDDWRHYDDDRTAYTAYPLPDDIAAMCIRIVRALGLIFGAIDLVLTPEGEYVFLEVNPNGQWGFVADATGLPIADAIAGVLTDGALRPETSHAPAV